MLSYLYFSWYTSNWHVIRNRNIVNTNNLRLNNNRLHRTAQCFHNPSSRLIINADLLPTTWYFLLSSCLRTNEWLMFLAGPFVLVVVFLFFFFLFFRDLILRQHVAKSEGARGRNFAVDANVLSYPSNGNGCIRIPRGSIINTSVVTLGLFDLSAFLALSLHGKLLFSILFLPFSPHSPLVSLFLFFPSSLWLSR